MACDEVDELVKALKRAHGNAGFGVDCANRRDFMRALGALRTIEAETAAAIDRAKHHDCIPLDEVKEVAQQ